MIKNIHIELFVLCIMALLLSFLGSLFIQSGTIEMKEAVYAIYEKSDAAEQNKDTIHQEEYERK